MKRFISLLFVVSILFLFVGCGILFEEKHITDVSEYGNVEDYIEFPEFFPKSVADYQVNSYSYTLLSYMDVCYEIFLDISVTEEQFNALISDIKSLDGIKTEREAYYADGYYEIVFLDSYSMNEEDRITGQPQRVWNAKIVKVIYNPETYNIVFECFDAFDSGVYLLNEVAYFNRFAIDQTEYVNYLP